MKLPAEVLGDLEHRPSRLDLALAFARDGWKVFPVAAGTKDRPLIKAWQKLASTDPKVIRAWWSRWPDANIAIVPGLSNAMVVDLDVDEEKGIDGFATWEALNLPDASEYTVRTPRGGQHMYYRIPDGSPVPQSIGEFGLGPGIDIKSENNYVLAAGSSRSEGSYSVGFGWPLGRPEELPAASERLLALARSRRANNTPHEVGVPTASDTPVRTRREPLGQAGVIAAFARELEAIRTAPKSTGNNALNEAAFNIGQLVGPHGINEVVARDAVAKAARDRGRPEAELMATIDSAITAGMANPRPVASAADERELRVRAKLEEIQVNREARRRDEDERRMDQDNPGRMVAGGEFALDIPDGTPAVWGDGTPWSGPKARP